MSVAAEIERRAPVLDNLLVTIVELEQRPRPVHPLIESELRRQAAARVADVQPSAVAPLGRASALAVTLALGAVLVWARIGGVDASTPASTPALDVARGLEVQQPHVTMVITPPPYTSLPPTTARDAEHGRVEVLEGSRVRIEVAPVEADVQLVETGRAPLTFQRSGDVGWLELTADRTQFLLVRFAGASTIPDRLLALLVKPDAAPVVRIRQPARDLMFPEPRGRVKVEVEATDDLALNALSLRYTRVFGSGESTIFQEGDWPLRVERVERGQWHATSEISLEDLQLEEGDTLVYRATTRDLRPGRDPSSSEAYLLEVGKLGAAPSAGFSLPEDKDRQALSQQMLIVKTERLHAQRTRLSRAEFEDQARLLAVEQRMVRAEFVFMTGGEVQDEVEEAEHSHDLAEGRFENEGQVELLTAIREMSRAEARLNDAATEPALVFERAALKALQRAFDRRRYLLRTMPERARIDQTRRLTGTLSDARSWRRPGTAARRAVDVETFDALARDLAASRLSGELGPLAVRFASIDPNAAEIQQAALRLSAGAALEAERSAAIDEALRLLAERARKALFPTRTWVARDPAAGRYADAVAQEGKR